MLDTLIGDYPMRIIRTSRLTGNTTHWDMPITQAQMDAWVDGELIQNAMPHLFVNPSHWENFQLALYFLQYNN